VVTIVVSHAWAHRGQTRFEGRPGPLLEVLRDFAEEHPAFRDRLLGPDGEPRTYYNVSVDDDQVPRHERPTAVVPEGSCVLLIPPIVGG
jgi:hypothetical protein